jgi:tRNA dimethylallyltransferase
LLSGRPLSDWHSGTPGNAAAMDHYRVLCVALAPQDRAVLHQRIEARFRQMMAAGFLDEVRALFARGDLDPSLPALRSVGYRQLWSHLAGELSLEQAVDQGVIATRQLAKRQLTWLRKWPDLKWIFTDAAGAPIVGDGGPNLRASDLILNYLA